MAIPPNGGVRGAHLAVSLRKPRSWLYAVEAATGQIARSGVVNHVALCHHSHSFVTQAWGKYIVTVRSGNPQYLSGHFGGSFWYWEEDKGVLLLDLERYSPGVAETSSRSAVTVPAARRPASGGLRRAVAGTGCVALLAVAGGLLPAPASATTKRVLQSVVVSLSPDGSLTKVQATDVSQDADGRFRSSKKDIDPRVAAAGIPVVASIAYVHDGRTGTNLEDLDGVKGLVEISITLTNTSARSESFTTGGAASPSFAQVSIPLTVVGTATLPKSSYSEIMLPPAGTTDPHTTNGAVRPVGKEKTVVEWASVLAPPRLPSSATFRIVERTDGFVLPDITLSVQPGLVADPSLAQLLTRAFGDDSPILRLENAALGLAQEVKTNLDHVERILDGVHAELIEGANDTGVEATRNLHETTLTARDNLEELVRSLGVLGETVTTALDETNALADARLEAALRGLQDYIGLPGALPVPASSPPSGSALPRPSTAACSAAVAPPAAASSLYQQIQHITGLLRAATTVTGDCVAAMRDVLLSTIGDKASCAVPPAGPPPVVCRILSARDQLATVKADIVSQAEDIAASLRQSGLPDIGAAVDKTVDAVAALQQNVRLLRDSSGPRGGLVGKLRSVRTAVDNLLAGTNPAASEGLGHEIAALHRAAVAARDAVGTSADGETSGTTRGQLKALAGKVCELPAGDPAVSAQIAELRARIDGGACPSTTPVPMPGNLTQRASEDHAAWQQVVDLTDLDGPSGAGAELIAVRDQLTSLRTKVDAALEELDETAIPDLGDGVSKRLKDVVDLTEALLDVTTSPAQCGPPEEDDPPLNALRSTFGHVKCNQDTVAGKLQNLATAAPSKLDQLSGDLDSASTEVDQARSSANGRLNDLLQTLTGRLAGTADAELARGIAALQAQVAVLRKTVEESTSLLDDATRDALRRIDEVIEAARTSDAQANALLQASLTQVIRSLGAPDAEGLLYLIHSNGGLVDTAGTRPVREASRKAGGFGTARRLNVQEHMLEIEQHERGLDRVDSPDHYLGGELPADVPHVSVYTFRLAGD